MTMTVVALCAVVTMAAAGDKIGEFDAVVAGDIFVVNDAGDVIIGIGATDSGYGLIKTYQPNGKELVI